MSAGVLGSLRSQQDYQDGNMGVARSNSIILDQGSERRIRVDRANRIIMDRGLVLLCYLPSHSIKCSATVNSGHSLLNLFLVKTSELFPREIAIR